MSIDSMPGGKMQIQHRGERPQVDETAWVAPTAVVSGAVTVGPRARIAHGAVVTAERDTTLTVGSDCVIMEQAVLRSAGRFDLSLGANCLVGPHAYLTGCSVRSRTFIATGGMVFNGASLGEACVVALDGKVHIDSDLPAGTRVPMGHIAFGRPADVYGPERAIEVHNLMDQLGFMDYVFGVESHDRPRGDVMDEAMTKYAHVLGAHRDDVIVD
jgi:carbonic anhydrase/acetyltransferase-like protein (isoleucine patch superfamily)